MRFNVVTGNDGCSVIDNSLTVSSIPKFKNARKLKSPSFVVLVGTFMA